jgi:hypothetical protein
VPRGSWVGWLWDDERWWRAVAGHTIPEAASALSRAADEAGVPDVWTVLTRGGVPVGPPPGWGKARCDLAPSR